MVIHGKSALCRHLFEQKQHVSSNIYNYHVADQLYIVCIKAVWMPCRLAFQVVCSVVTWDGFLPFALICFLFVFCQVLSIFVFVFLFFLYLQFLFVLNSRVIFFHVLLFVFDLL